jgi:hypothetical protein
MIPRLLLAVRVAQQTAVMMRPKRDEEEEEDGDSLAPQNHIRRLMPMLLLLQRQGRIADQGLPGVSPNH